MAIRIDWPSGQHHVLATTKLHDVAITGVSPAFARIKLVFADTKEPVPGDMVTAGGLANTMQGNDYINGVSVVDGRASFKVKPNALSSQHHNRNFAYLINVADKEYYSDEFKVLTKIPRTSRKRPHDDAFSDGSDASSVCSKVDELSEVPLIDYDELTAILSETAPTDDTYVPTTHPSTLEEVCERLVNVERLQSAILDELKRLCPRALHDLPEHCVEHSR